MNGLYTTGKKAEETTVSDAVIYIKSHKSKEVGRLLNLKHYYDGEHLILSRQRKRTQSNNRVVTNHAKYIADFTSSYMLSSPAKYSADFDFSAITDALRNADSVTQDIDLSLDGAIYGRCYDMYYADSESNPKLARLSPLNAFVVYDDTVEQNPVFAVYYFPVFDKEGKLQKYKCSLQTAYYTQNFELSAALAVISEDEPIQHFFGIVPINEIYNNAVRQGDFEQVISLIDAYNVLQSDRVNDKEQFVNAILLISGAVLGDDEEEKSDTVRAMNRDGVLELPEGAAANYLTRQFDESSLEILKKSIVSDIHKISGVPDMSDENFAGNASGVAMGYKLLGLEQVINAKQRYFTEGLKYRLKAFANFLSVKGNARIDTDSIKIEFNRRLPTNQLETAQVVATLQSILPTDVLMTLIPFVENPEEVARKAEKEKAEAVKRQQEMFSNTPIRDSNEE